MDKAQVVNHLRNGLPVRFAFTECSWVEAHELIDDLQYIVGLPIERREVVDASGTALLIWIRGFATPPLVAQYTQLGDDHAGFHAD